MWHVSFDLDGTLIDSLPLMKRSWSHCNEKLGLNIAWSTYKAQIGLPFRNICQNLGVSKNYQEIKHEYFDFNKRNIDLIKPMDGLDDLLGCLRRNQIEWSIITSKPRTTTEPILKRFGLDTDVCITSDDVSSGKPNRLAGDLLRKEMNAQKFLYVGDTIIDHCFALNSDFEFVRCQFDGQEVLLDDVKAYGVIQNPHKVVHGLKELSLHIAKLANDANIS